MGSSRVSIGGAGFWMADGVLELWLRLLALHIEDPAGPGSIAGRIRDQWLLASRGFFTGGVPHELDAAVSTDEGEAVVRAAIHSVLRALHSAPSHLSKDVVNMLGFSGEWTADIETRRLVEVAHAFLALLDGKISSDPSDTSFMPGSRKSPTTPSFDRLQVYVVVRLDFSGAEELRIPRDMGAWEQSAVETYGPMPLSVSGTKAFTNIEEAREHAARLNMENDDKGARYFVTLARLDRPAAY